MDAETKEILKKTKETLKKIEKHLQAQVSLKALEIQSKKNTGSIDYELAQNMIKWAYKD